MESSTHPATASRRDGDAASPTEPVDYVALNAVYATVLAAVVAATRNTTAERDPVSAGELLPLGAATFALAKVISKEKIGSWVREPFVEQGPDHRPRQPRGRRLQRAIGELLTCTRCAGAWSALAIVGLRTASPPAGRLVASVLATSAINDFLQAAFQLVTERANAAAERS
ncbi:MAG: DUF1360 domain-containing protein [Actinomycetota bacterium]|nr:DUF1360 domain-containing protein [Actinomycetota bacterium]